MAELVDLVWVAGGTTDARRMRTAQGFRTVATIHALAAPIRPLAIELTRDHRDLKTPARWLRNSLWRQRIISPEAGWRAELWYDPGPVSWIDSSGFDRSLQFAAYYARYPVARIRWYRVLSR